MATGIDTIRAGGVIRGGDWKGPGWTFQGATGPDGSYQIHGRRREIGSGVWLSVVPSRDALTAWVEGSAARAVRGVNFPAVTVAEAGETVVGWFEDAREWVEWGEGPRLNRLDVVRDFEVGPEMVGKVLAGVGGFHAGGRATRAVYRDPTVNRAMTVWARTKRSGGGRLYDKGAESGLVEAAGVVRFEGQERRATLDRVGVSSVASLDEARAARLLRERWEWSGFGAVASGRDAWMDAVWSRIDWRVDTRLKLVGWAMSGFPALPKSTGSDYRRRLREVGQVDVGGVGDRWRLELEAGELVMTG